MNKDGAVPAWDGQPKGWRRYCREVCWFVQSTKVNQRRHLATRLIARLSGSARLLAMSWPQSEFDHERGVLTYLQRLAKSPLVRRSLPNAAATMTQYFGFKRMPNESISSFLVRETLSYEEFQEALSRLREERAGVDPADQDFGLEAVFQRSDDWQWNHRWYPEQRDVGTTPMHRTPAGSPARSRAGAADDDGDEDRPKQVDYEPVPTSSPQPSVHDDGPSSPKRESPDLGLTSADSFVLDVLRGWRLLQAASLNKDEWRDILSSTGNKLDFESISNALQVLWDEQLMQPRSMNYQATGSSSYQLNWMDDDSTWTDDNWWFDDSWQDAQWLWDGSDEWADGPEVDDPEASNELTPAELEDPQLREAMQSQKVAESLAAEAKLTWQKTQEATAALRKDRGFGAVTGGKSNGKTSTSGCFICGHPSHLARDCPDKWAPRGKGKSKSKFGMVASSSDMYFDPYMNSYAMAKGKGKYKGSSFGKSANMSANMMDYDNMWFQKGKSKGSRPSSFKGGSVNAYGLELYPMDMVYEPHVGDDVDLHPLEFLPATSSSSPMASSLPQASGTLQPYEGMIDSGATASAGPQASIQRVFQCLQEIDQHATLETNMERRPYFRYGSGKWSRALCEVVLSSSLSGSLRQFRVFALPNPPEFSEQWFDASLLVPILIGMDFLGPQGVGMIIDFNDGYSWTSGVMDSSPRMLKQSSKGHFVLDLVEFLTDQPGVPHQVQSSTKNVQFASHVDVLELHPMVFDDLQQHEMESKPKTQSVEIRRQFVKMCVDRHRSTVDASAQSFRVPNSMSTSVSSAIDVNNSYKFSDHVQGQVCREGGTKPGSEPHTRTRSTGSTLQRCLAMFQESQQLRARIEQVRSMGIMQRVCPENGVHSSRGYQSQSPGLRGSGDGGARLEPCQERFEGQASTSPTDDRCPEQGGVGHDLRDHAPEAEFSSEDLHRDAQVKGQSQELSQPGAVPGQHVSPVLAVRGGALAADGRVPSGDDGIDDGGAACRDDGPVHEPPGVSSHESQRRDVSSNFLPNYVGKAAMIALSMLNMTIMSCFQGLVVEPQQVSVWEVCCSPHSWLTTACMQEGLSCQRINLANGFDFSKPATFEKMTHLYQLQRPKRLWISMRCTLWCPWTSVNYNTEARQEVLETKRRHERQVLRRMVQWLLDNVLKDPSVHVYWEWPARCLGWHQSSLQLLADKLFEGDRDWLSCRIDGCRYGLMSTRPGHLHEFLHKKWLIKTTDQLFHNIYKTKVCVGNHPHAVIESQDTAKTSYYPWRLCVSIAKTWKEHLFPQRWLNKLFIIEDDTISDEHYRNTVLDLDSASVLDFTTGVERPCENHQFAMDFDGLSEGDLQPLSGHPSSSTTWIKVGHGRWTKASGDSQQIAQPSELQPDEETIKKWDVQLLRFHRAAGHPSNRNLARIVREAGKAPWQVDRALALKCSACEATKPGGSSSGKVPPASTSTMPSAWAVIMIDIGEWTMMDRQLKLKFLLVIDAATRFKATSPLMTYPLKKQGNESGQQVVEAFAQCWLAEKPRPTVIVPDNANTFLSTDFREFCNANNLWLHPPVEKEAWAHGTAERAIQEVKLVMDKIYITDSTLSPFLVLSLATSSLNAVENVHGYSPFQWAYGQAFRWTDEDVTTHLTLQSASPTTEFQRLLALRHQAEQLARQSRAEGVLSKLKNSCPRQPIREFSPTTLVKVWKKALPHEAHKGRRGGFAKSVKPHWIGPGRVLFQELLPGQEDSDRRHVVWVVIGGRVHRCSVHSCRPLTEQETVFHEIQHGREELEWKSLKDILPRRDYVDLLDDEPTNEDRELPDLPDQPDSSTWISPVRLRRKTHHSAVLPAVAPPQAPVNEYLDPTLEDGVFDDDEVTGNVGGLPSRRSSITSTTPLLKMDDDAASSGYAPTTPADAPVSPLPMPEDDDASGEKRPGHSPDADDHEEPDSKRARLDESEEIDSKELHYLLDDAEFGYIMELDLEFASHRKLKRFLHSPSAFLVQQLRDTEVRYEKLTPQLKKLFDRAKDREVSSFVQSEAVRKCTEAEEREGWESGRVIGCRWVLTWKSTSPEDLPAAQQDAKTNPNTLFTPSGEKKSKARIVLLGYQHPDLLQPQFRSSSPVQATISRHLTFQMSIQRQWTIEGLDLSTAFLQTEKNQEQHRLWTQGTAELRSALGVSQQGLLRILKDFYGSTTAPRGLWQDIDRRLQSLGAHKILGDPCVWIWVKPNLQPINELDGHTVIGYMAGHVDDFNRSGDDDDPLWLDIKAQIDSAYRWGTAKRGQYRYVGCDLEIKNGATGTYLEINQDFYVETLTDLNIEGTRFAQPKLVMTKAEISQCRASLGALQWLAIQTQPLICARCNLLLSDLAREPTMVVAQEIQKIIVEVRKGPTRLSFRKIPTVSHWQQVVIVTMGDQAHNNRPDGSSTGGLINLIGGPELLEGQPGPMSLLSWKTWKLRRMAISSNDAEIQAMVEAEDVNFRTRLLWAELNGSGVSRKDRDFLMYAERAVKMIPGIVATDSKGGFDAVTLQEGPYLGLTNVRAAIQAFQLKQSLALAGTNVIWLAGDWLLGDAFTKRSPECRKSLIQFLQQGVWMLKYSPDFTVSARKAKTRGLDAVSRIRAFDRMNG